MCASTYDLVKSKILLFAKVLSHEYTGHARSKKIHPKHKVSVQVSLHGLSRLNRVDSYCKCRILAEYLSYSFISQRRDFKKNYQSNFGPLIPLLLAWRQNGHHFVFFFPFLFYHVCQLILLYMYVICTLHYCFSSTALNDQGCRCAIKHHISVYLSFFGVAVCVGF